MIQRDAHQARIAAPSAIKTAAAAHPTFGLFHTFGFVVAARNGCPQDGHVGAASDTLDEQSGQVTRAIGGS